MRGTLLITLALVGCTSWAPRDEARDASTSLDASGDANTDRDAFVSPVDGGLDAAASLDAGSALDAGADAALDGRVALDGASLDAHLDLDAGPPCPAIEARTVRVITADIVRDETWTCATRYELQGEIHVQAATLTITAGTVIYGRDDSSLVVERDARLVAVGRAEAPIVFTSPGDATGDRDPGDWQGVALVGRAGPADTLDDGLDTNIPYGGGAASHDCGTLRYVRIEFSGGDILDAEGDSLGAFALAGCGTDTEIDFVQVHRSKWEGVRVRGGTVDLRHLVLTEIGDEALEWSLGWNGSAQHLLVQQDRDISVGLQADGPSAPIVANATLVGRVADGRAGVGCIGEEGASATITNVIVIGYGVGVLDVDETTSLNAGTSFRLVRSFTHDTPTEPSPDIADGTFSEADYLAAASNENHLDRDPLLEDRYVQRFDLRPAAGSAVDEAGCPSDSRLDPGACYAGGIDPSGSDWSVGWITHATD